MSMRRPLRPLPARPEGDAPVLDFSRPGDRPYLRGTGDTDLVCGACGGVLVQGVGGFVHHFLATRPVLACACGAYNAVDP